MTETVTAFQHIVDLLAEADALIVAAALEPDPDLRQDLHTRAAGLRREAAGVASDEQPEVVHADYDLGVVLGVTKTGRLLATFNRMPFLEELAVDAVREVP